MIDIADHEVDHVINVADHEVNHTTGKVVLGVGQGIAEVDREVAREIVEVDHEIDIGVEVGLVIDPQDILDTDLIREVRLVGIRKHRNVPRLHRHHQDRDQEAGHVIAGAVAAVRGHDPVQNHLTKL